MARTAHDRGDGRCPICGSELTPAEGPRGTFWRCVTGDYTRDFDAVPPKDGRIPCANCGAQVRFDTWGQDYAWRCETNPRHHQRLYLSHLKLPKMAALVPADAARKLRAAHDDGSGQPRLL